jgi:type IV pilus assembly protein PilQ
MRSSMKHLVLTVAFFCTWGWVCNSWAIGDDLTGPADGTVHTATATASATTAADVAAPLPAALDAAPSATAPIQPVRDGANFDLVSLNVQNTDLAQVLQMLSIQHSRNIVPSPKVTGSVTANLYDVTFHEALDAILQQNGAGYIEKGNFIFIYTLDELKKIQDAERRVSHRVFRLNYITATDASTFVTPLLSSAGSIAITGAVGAGIQPTISDVGGNSYSSFETMIIRDYPENLEEIAKIITALDIRPEQVLIEATILQANLTDELAFGVDISILGDLGLGSFTGSPLDVVGKMLDGSVSDTPSGAVNSTVGNTTSGDAGIRVGILTDNVQAFVRALDRVTDTTIVANPKIMTLNRQRAEVLVGQKVAYLSTTATATATTQTVEFLDTGTQLTVRPFVSNDGMIRLELKPSISSAELRPAGTGTGAVLLPDETTQELTTNVMIRDGQTVVLGGLFTEETTISRNQVPGLGDIPVVGNAFKGRDDTLERSEVIFLITPHIVRDKEIAEAGEAAMQGVEQIRIGTREHLLPWSRTKLSAAHMRDALSHLENNQPDKALWEVDLALGLDPSMIEARRLKEKLTGQRQYWPSSSQLNDAVNLMIERKLGKPHPVPAVPVVPNPAPAELEMVPGGRAAADAPVIELAPRIEPAAAPGFLPPPAAPAAPAAAPAPADSAPAAPPAQPVNEPAAQPVSEPAPAVSAVEPAASEPSSDLPKSPSDPVDNTVGIVTDQPTTPADSATEAAPDSAPQSASESAPAEPDAQAPADPATEALFRDFGK